ncbi:RNA polymerase sigma factor RpoH [Arenicella chitinivorans]|uniref:RNA polymerase sigma factor n=1 Tax=Arenicella chitinivorans TaxID=1329800 RepID=A0A918VN77_9GAMM|nr:RNA polymerase sigma factor RpoH [Arenicella chitinivorans]GHA10066.1 RNA polymerase sigma factor RpoH [Arenicella chitinivorans]
MAKTKTTANPVSLPQDTNLASFLQVANSAPVLTAETEARLARQYRDNDDVDAARQLVVSQLRHVIHVAKSFTGYGLPVADLIQEGNIGLMKAVKNFDPDRGIRLVSYAVHWIKAEIYEYVLKNWKIVKVATTKAQRKLFFNLRKSRKSLSALTEQETQDLASDLDVPVKTVREMEQRLTSNDVAFDGQESDDDEFTTSPSAYLPDMRYNPEELVMKTETSDNNRDSLYAAIEDLDDRSKDILQRRWLSESKATLHELAAEYNVSAERIRQIEKRAMQKMKGQLAA